MNYKIRVENEAESKEAQELFFELGYKKYNWSHLDQYPIQINAASKNMTYSDFRNSEDLNGIKKVTLPELHVIVSLHKNPINMDKVLSEVRSDALGLLNDQYAEIEKVRKETQARAANLPVSDEPRCVDDVLKEICKDKHSPTGAMLRAWDNHHVGRCADAKPNQTTINAMNEADTLFVDAVNHPSHYASGEIECIDAMEAMLTPEQFIGYLRGNAFKYQWRYENKGGITDLEKAQWYLNKLISRIG